MAWARAGVAGISPTFFQYRGPCDGKPTDAAAGSDAGDNGSGWPGGSGCCRLGPGQSAGNLGAGGSAGHDHVAAALAGALLWCRRLGASQAADASGTESGHGLAAGPGRNTSSVGAVAGTTADR